MKAITYLMIPETQFSHITSETSDSLLILLITTASDKNQPAPVCVRHVGNQFSESFERYQLQLVVLFRSELSDRNEREAILFPEIE